MTVTGDPLGLGPSQQRQRRGRSTLDLRGPEAVLDLGESEADYAGARARKDRNFGSGFLRSALVGFDAMGLAGAWLLAILVLGTESSRSVGQELALVGAIVLGGLLIVAHEGLYRARVNSVRMNELSRVVRASVVIAVGALIGASVVDIDVAYTEAIVGGLLTLAFLLVCRGGFRAWLNAQRAKGRFCRPVVIVGTNHEARHLVDLLRVHPETGLQVTAVFGSEVEAEALGLGALYGGTVDQAVLAVDAAEITGALVAVSAIDPPTLNRIVRELVATGTHVHLTSGLSGIASRRLQSHSIAHEPVLYLEPLRLAWWQEATKRMLDITGALLVLVPTAPIIALSALVVRLTDGGPALFRQARVGRNGEVFDVLKIRTMVVDAEERLDELQHDNERAGPLFKVSDDPRFTKFGRFLDITSINELPQLWNVLRGEMSLVGPRPPLPSEACKFDEELRARFMVRPGITGLWQVEARDNPSFEAYRRLDLHYVENWSVTFDLVILMSTIEVVASRLLRGLRGVRRRAHRKIPNKPLREARTADDPAA